MTRPTFAHAVEHPGLPATTRYRIDGTGDTLNVQLSLDDPNDHRGVLVSLARLGWAGARVVRVDVDSAQGAQSLQIACPRLKLGDDLEEFSRSVCAALTAGATQHGGASLCFELADFPGWASTGVGAHLGFVTDAEANHSVRRTTAIWEDALGAHVEYERDQLGRVTRVTVVRVNKSGRPAELQRLLSPGKGKAKGQPPKVEQVGFRRVHYAWYKRAPHYESVWVHPSGVTLWQCAEPVASYHHGSTRNDEGDRRQEHSLQISGLLVGGPAADAAARPYLPESVLRESVKRTLDALLRFGPRELKVHDMEIRPLTAMGAIVPVSVREPAARPQVTSSPRTTALPLPNREPAWALGVAPWARPALLHLADHGSASEEDVVRLLGSSRLARRFAKQAESLAHATPLEIRVEVVAGVKHYIRTARHSE